MNKLDLEAWDHDVLSKMVILDIMSVPAAMHLSHLMWQADAYFPYWSGGEEYGTPCVSVPLPIARVTVDEWNETYAQYTPAGRVKEAP